jgi:hypothetical protein
VSLRRVVIAALLGVTGCAGYASSPLIDEGRSCARIAAALGWSKDRSPTRLPLRRRWCCALGVGRRQQQALARRVLIEVYTQRHA